MTEEAIACPICGTRNKAGSDRCNMCKTRLAERENGTTKVSSPKPRAKTHIMIDIEDPLTRKKLEELTLIPGVTRKKALLLYQSGIHSIEDFMMKAFQGERFSANYSRTVANKLLVQSLGGKRKKAVEMPCPSCKAPNPATGKKCKVCNFDIEGDMKSVDMEEISEKLNDSVKEILDGLSASEDFASLPDSLKQQFAAAIDSDDFDMDMEKPKEMESLGIDLDNIGQEDPVPEAATQPEVAQQPAAPAPEPAPGKSATKEEKIRQVLSEKLVKWRKTGYDVAPLEPFLDDVDGFKLKAKEVLGEGKIIKLKYEKQLEMWREKGFDVSELRAILDIDVDLFPNKAKEILKKQKK